MSGGPHLAAAILCERVILDGDVMSLVHVLERVAVAAGAAPVKLTLLVLIARGDARGPIAARVIVRSPTGDQVATIDVRADLPPAPEAIGRVLVPVALDAVQDGVYWFEVALRAGADDAPAAATRVPLRVAITSRAR